ncbi:putative DNA damage response protein Rtt109 [Talaromyces proteolyticus]|uniref:histone acetyltransferase n=1 Tax=Talaromyces proteolyticus TaxID=1131652 RepID=A0AAD4KXT4_9EURO|nr:putative DNA damage response protein Rtt109 [Talaromyces proteolyticus]KAH8702235.1 putative DNA damage response protein Rtt109 [Talaromyces proteolyticus]
MATPKLADLLAEVLPQNIKLNVRHISTPPTPSDAIFSAPPGETPEATFCENHFFVASLNRFGNVDDEIAVLGIEVSIYTTDRLTIVFVSKADSTGYIHLVNKDAQPPSLRLIVTTFLSYLIRTHQRPGIRLVLSLFARAQNQYLFPGSVDNAQKHVLDDRGLIKWWCQTADPILREHTVESQDGGSKSLVDESIESVSSSATGYLLVPGCDKYETRAFFPATARSDDQKNPRWRVSYPLNQICIHPQAPPRCLVPRFPDDPKARFLVDLDGELSEGAIAGQWKSVKSLDEFWEMMAFRQECSAGRLVGFLWVVINPPGVLSSDKLSNQTQEAGTTDKVQNDALLSGTAAEAESDNRSLNHLQDDQPKPNTEVRGNTFFWPEAGRGEIVLCEKEYKSGNDELLEQDFETEELAMAGTMAWVRKIASLADVLWWGKPVTGKREISKTTTSSKTAAVTINSGLNVRKRKKDAEGDDTLHVEAKDEQAVSSNTTQAETESGSPEVNVLNASFIKKKKKT